MKREKEEEDATDDELVGSLQPSSQSVSNGEGVIEEVAETSEKLVEGWPRLDEVDEEIVGSRKEDIVEIGDDEFRWVVGSRLRKPKKKVSTCRDWGKRKKKEACSQED